jgi:hypothetical protein
MNYSFIFSYCAIFRIYDTFKFSTTPVNTGKRGSYEDKDRTIIINPASININPIVLKSRSPISPIPSPTCN